MDRSFASGAAGSPPSYPGSPSIGYPTAGNPSLAVPATKPGPWWYYMINEELRAVLVAAGITPDGSNTTQLLQAIQALITSGSIKIPVRAASTANIATLAGGAPNTLDGVTLAANDRLLLKDQTTASQNGLYVVTTLGTGANGTWTRATDADGAGELIAGSLVVVQEGTAAADSIWELSTDGAISIGSTALTFTRKDITSARQIQPVSASVASNALTITASALSLDFRSATLGSGTVTTVSGTPSNLVVPSSATLGTISGVTHRLLVLAINNAGTIELAVVNPGGIALDECGVISTTAISSGSNSAGVAYSTTARASVPYRIIGFLDISEATAGTWASAPTVIQGAGGLAKMQSTLLQGAAVNTTSGTSIDFTNIPDYATRITIGFNGISTSGTSNPVIRLGTAAGIQTSTYNGGTYGGQAAGSQGCNLWSANSGIDLHYSAAGIGAASDTRYGQLILTRLNPASNIWSVSGGVCETAATISQFHMAGAVTLNGAITTVRLTTAGGSDTFDGGSMNVSWE